MINKVIKKDFIYHAGTKIIDGQILSNGGRVLNVTSTGNRYSYKKKILSILKFGGDFIEKIFGK